MLTSHKSVLKKLLIHIVFVFLICQTFAQTDTIWTEEKPDKQFYANLIAGEARDYIIHKIKDDLVKTFLTNRFTSNYHCYSGCPGCLSETTRNQEQYWQCFAEHLFCKYFYIDTAFVLIHFSDSIENSFRDQDLQIPFYFSLPELDYRKSYELHRKKNSNWECEEIMIPEYILSNEPCNFLSKPDLIKVVGILGYNIDKVPEDCRNVGLNRKLIDDAYLDYDAAIKQWVWRFYTENNDSSLCERKVSAVIITGECDRTIIRQILTD